MLNEIHQLCLCLLSLSFFILNVSAKKELRLLQVLSINKFYVPDNIYSSPSASPEFKVPKNLTYEYFARNALDIPNSVKLDLFNLGVELRESYDKFLGSIYRYEIAEMYTTEFPASIMIGELINAGLWPPVEPQIWNDNLAWQPIPIDYVPAEEDTLLLGTLCPNFQLETSKVLKSDTYDRLKSVHSDLLGKLNETGHIKVTNLLEIPPLYFALESSVRKSNQSLAEWVKEIYPKRKKDLLNATLAAYGLLSETIVQRQLNGGSFIKRIIENCNERIEAADVKSKRNEERKLIVYSGDDRVFAGVARNLNIPLHDIPDPGAALIFELLEENNDHFVKIVYMTGEKNELLPLTLPSCDIFCPIDKFSQLMAKVLPADEATLCFTSVPQNVPAASPSIAHFSSNLLLLLLLLTFIYN